MSLNQISVFVENKPGKLQELTDILAKMDVNMRALSLAETAEFGIARIIVDELDSAVEMLKAEEYIYGKQKESIAYSQSLFGQKQVTCRHL